MKNLLALIFSIMSFVGTSIAQNADAARGVISELTSEKMWGRGYTNNGMHNAASYIAGIFKSKGLLPLDGKTYFQQLSYPVNTFPGKMELEINDAKLVPGRDFLVSPDCKGIKGKGRFAQADSNVFINREERLVVSIVDKLTWSVARKEADFSSIEILKTALTQLPKSFKVNVENEFVPSFSAANIAAMVKGTKYPDSFLVITAHYDHLGGMGKDTYFPGANDNASGVALMLSLAGYYAQNPPLYSVAFIAFTGEEAGLVGSKYYTENPLFPLANIAFLLNTDLAGTGEDGITVVNATEYTAAFTYLNQVNEEQKLLKKINARGKAANSDHYFFSEKGVPAFFFYTLGGPTAYHDIYDKEASLPLTEHNDLMKLVIGFNEKIMSRSGR